jgi:CRISPR system Cascade subunit CasA
VKNAFNLIDEPWIEVSEYGLVSLRQIFENKRYLALGGSPQLKICLLKFLTAIAMAACKLKTEEELMSLSSADMSKKCLNYLTLRHDQFYLYGERPFLQMPQISGAKEQPLGALQPEVAAGNTTVLTQTQLEHHPTDALKAQLVLLLQSSALGGKKADNKVVLSPSYMGKTKPNGKPTSASPGPAVSYLGLTHTFLMGKTLIETVWLNLFSEEAIEGLNLFSEGIGVPPWESMPEGEDDDTAKRLKSSLMGRLVPVSRFCLLSANGGMHITEGLAHLNYADGIYDLSISVDNSLKKTRVLWVNPNKRPWRELPALLSFIGANSGGFRCYQLQVNLKRARSSTERFGIWSGGLKVSSNAGEQYVSGGDDYVESLVWFDSNVFGDSTWFDRLSAEMQALESVSKNLYAAVRAYFTEFKLEGADHASKATQIFWEIMESRFGELSDCCEESATADLRIKFRRNTTYSIAEIYDDHCPSGTARQIETWAESRPNMSKYLKGEK